MACSGVGTGSDSPKVFDIPMPVRWFGRTGMV
jgi:hypothetical protein